MCHDWSPDSPQTDNPRNNGEKTNSVYHLPKRPKGLWQGMARRYHVRPPQKRSRRENPKNDKKLNSNLSAITQTRYGLTRRINIKDSIRQGGVISVIEYATRIDEVSKELKEKNLGYVTEANITLDSLLWMDDVCLIHHDLNKLQEILDVMNSQVDHQK